MIKYINSVKNIFFDWFCFADLITKIKVTFSNEDSV